VQASEKTMGLTPPGEMSMTISDDVEQLRLQGFVSLTSAIIFIHFKTNLIRSVS